MNFYQLAVYILLHSGMSLVNDLAGSSFIMFKSFIGRVTPPGKNLHTLGRERPSHFSNLGINDKADFKATISGNRKRHSSIMPKHLFCHLQFFMKFQKAKIATLLYHSFQLFAILRSVYIKIPDIYSMPGIFKFMFV